MRRSVMIFCSIIALILPSTLFANVCGDVNVDATVNVGDAVYLINYVFKGGPAPDCGTEFGGVCGDVNGDAGVNVGDAVYLINYVFKGGPDPYCLTYTIPSTTIIISPDDTTVIQAYDTTTGILTLDESSTYAQNVSVGDIIIGQDDQDAFYGFLRKVTSKSSQRNSIILETETATMMEAFEQMYISETQQLTPSDIRSCKLADGVTLRPDKDDESFNVDVDVVLYDMDGNHQTTNDQIKLEGNFGFSAALFVEIDMEWFTLKKFEAGIESSQEANIDLIASLQWEFGEEIEFDLVEYYLGAIWIGPVVLVPTLTVEAHIHGDLSITFETGVSFTQELRLGFGWDSYGFYPINECTKEYTYNPPQLSVEFNFEPGISLNASLMIYGVAGPYVGGKVGIHFQAALNADPCDVELLFDLEAILYAIVGIECDLLDLDYHREFELYTHPVYDWTFPLNGTGTVIIDPYPDIINAPWSLAGPCSYSSSGTGDETLTELSPGDYTVTWGTVSGWITPSNSTQTLAAYETVTFNGIYIEGVGSGTIVIDPSPDILNAPWSLSGPDSYSTSGTGDETLTDLDPGDYTVDWGTVTGWITPSNSMQTLVLNETVTFSGTYIEEGSGTVTDIDGNVYQTVTIGTQEWMAENLKVTHYRNGNAIPNVTDNSTWEGLTMGAYCEYDNNPANVDTYGRLYNWFAVGDGRDIAPAGWHVPSDEEWKQLEMYLGMSQAAADSVDWRGTDEGGKLKESGTIHWVSPNTGATNESGFTALPGGCRYVGGGFYGMGYSATFWSSTENGSYARYRSLYFQESGIERYDLSKRYGFSVRCVRD